MPTENYLEQLNKNQSINPEFAPVTPGTLQGSDPAKTVIPMVSEDAIDTDMSDKIVFCHFFTPNCDAIDTDMSDKIDKAENVNETKPLKEPEKKEKTGFFGKIKKGFNEVVNAVEQGVKNVVIKANEWLDIKAIHDEIRTWDLSDDNKRAAAIASAKSKIEEIKARAGEYTAEIKDAIKQLETAIELIGNYDDDVRTGLARQLPNMQDENQAPIAENIAQHSDTDEPTREVIKQMPNCAVEQQAEIVNATTRGIVANQNYTDETKTSLGIETARQIINLDETQQAKAYECTANNMHEYEKVVDEVTNQVANVASEKVRQEAVERLQKSEHENVKASFTPENIKKVQEEYRHRLGVEEKTTEELQQEFTTDSEQENNTKQTNITDETAVTTAPQKTVKETPAQPDTVLKDTTVQTQDCFNSEEVSGVSTRYISTPKAENTTNSIQSFKECRTLADVEYVIKNAPKEEVKKFYERLNASQKLGLFKKTQAPEIQLHMLKHGMVKYEEVRNNLLPAVSSKLAVYTLNHDIEDAVKLI